MQEVVPRIIDYCDWGKITNKYNAWCIKSKEKAKDLVISYHQTKEKYLSLQGVWLQSDGWTSVQKFNYTISDSKETSTQLLPGDTITETLKEGNWVWAECRNSNLPGGVVRKH